MSHLVPFLSRDSVATGEWLVEGGSPIPSSTPPWTMASLGTAGGDLTGHPALDSVQKLVREVLPSRGCSVNTRGFTLHRELGLHGMSPEALGPISLQGRPRGVDGGVLGASQMKLREG